MERASISELKNRRRHKKRRTDIRGSRYLIVKFTGALDTSPTLTTTGCDPGFRSDGIVNAVPAREVAPLPVWA